MDRSVADTRRSMRLGAVPSHAYASWSCTGRRRDREPTFRLRAKARRHLGFSAGPYPVRPDGPFFWPMGAVRWQPMTALGGQPPTTEQLEPLMSIEEVAQVLRISERGIYRLMSRGEITSVKVGGRTLLEPRELRRFIAEQRCDAHPQEASQ